MTDLDTNTKEYQNTNDREKSNYEDTNLIWNCLLNHFNFACVFSHKAILEVAF